MALKKSELYSSLWSSCDELRGGMDASQYKDYVLVLLFIKYVSDKFAGAPYASITIPPGASFQDMVALKGKPDIGDQINKRIIAPLANANKLSDMPDFNAEKLGSGQEKVERLTNLIAIFENKALDFSKNRAEGDDILGDAYEYLMRHFATESGKSKGQFYTPAEVSRIMAKIVGIHAAVTTSSTTVYDPTCGSGSLLLKVGDEARIKVTLYGQEKDAATSGLARMNTILHNSPTASIVQGNTLADPKFKDGDTLKTFDFVVANPPFSDKRWSTGVFPDPYDRFQPFGTPPARQGDYAYLLHIVRSLRSAGKGACILPHGVLFRGNAEADIRRALIRKGYIKGIIGLPANLFYGTGIPACIVIIDKENAHTRKGIFMIDASAGFLKDRNKNRLRAMDLHKIVDVFNKRLELPKYSRMVGLEEIEKNEFNLNLSRYIDSQQAEDIQDIEAHLRGGIPTADVDALEPYWAVCPQLRQTLFQDNRPGYLDLAVDKMAIKPAIYDHPEFVAFIGGMNAVFAKWRQRTSVALKGLRAGCHHPKEVIADLSENLLAHYGGRPLIDKYDVYQHLMDYWAETMQDDCYLIAADGWKAETTRVLVKNNKGKQIADVFTDAGEAIQRTSSGRDLMRQLSQARPRLLCSLVHKFGKKDVDNFDQFIRELEAQPSQTVGDVFVFVDECHRTQSGKLHRVMKAIMPNAVFIGFTGTPLLKQDKQTSLEVFGGYIHTYKFSEAVEDEVVLDLIYEARDIGQRLGSEAKIDAWFDAKTKGLNDWQRAALREQWGTMQHVLSSRSRMDRVVSDIVFDFAVKPRLNDDRGNALLVVSSIYEACKYFTLFGKTVFKGRCAVVTSYNPQTREITMEDTGANTETDRQFIYNTYTELLKDIDAGPHMTKTETYEEWAKKLFKKEPANMKLLVVVDKLLTGFDAPPCTYLYIDKSMRDHGLFQAICRTNRLDGEDKEFGYIVDYKDLFKKVENAIAVYTSELDHSTGGVDPEILLKDRLTKGRERLDNALEAIAMICEPVDPPKGELEHIHYFCGNTEMGEDLKEHAPRRVAFYKAAAALVRAFANLADELDRAGYSEPEIGGIKHTLDRYLKLREIIRKASGETLDLKTFEADMRHLIDTYIEADQPRVISPFDNMSLLELIVKTGIADAINRLPDGIKSSRSAVAETIENNVRRKIVKEHLNDPAFYDRMSALLDEIIAARNARAIEYEEYLKRIADLAKRVEAGQAEDTPEEVNTPGRRALYNNLHQNRDLALKIDAAVKTARPDGWRGVQAKEQVVKRALYDVLQDVPEVERIFLIVTQQREY